MKDINAFRVVDSQPEFTSRGRVQLNLKGEVLEADPYFINLFELEENDIKGLALFDYCESDLSRFRKISDLLIYLDEGHFAVLCFRSCLGRQLILQLTGFFQKSGDSLIFEGIFKDITPQRELINQVYYEVEFSSQIIEKSSVIIGITDGQGQIVEVNPRALEISGYSREELIGREFWSLFVPNKDRKRAKKRFYRDLLKNGYIKNRELTCLTNENGTRVISWNVSTLRSEQDEITSAIGMGIDVTEEKELQRLLIQSEKLGAVGQMAAGIAHEIGHPLSSLSSIIQLAMEKSRDEELLEKFRVMEKEVFRLHRTVQTLLGLSRPTRFEPEPINVSQVVLEAERIARFDRRLKHCIIHTNCDSTVPSIKTSYDSLLQELLNLLLNSAEALEERADGKIAVQTLRKNGELEILFEDNGKGIPENVQPRIF